MHARHSWLGTVAVWDDHGSASSGPCRPSVYPSVKAVYSAVGRGTLPARKLGRRLVILEDELAAALHPVAPVGPAQPRRHEVATPRGAAQPRKRAARPSSTPRLARAAAGSGPVVQEASNSRRARRSASPAGSFDRVGHQRSAVLCGRRHMGPFCLLYLATRLRLTSIPRNRGHHPVR